MRIFPAQWRRRIAPPSVWRLRTKLPPIWRTRFRPPSLSEQAIPSNGDEEKASSNASARLRQRLRASCASAAEGAALGLVCDPRYLANELPPSAAPSLAATARGLLRPSLRRAGAASCPALQSSKRAQCIVPASAVPHGCAPAVRASRPIRWARISGPPRYAAGLHALARAPLLRLPGSLSRGLLPARASPCCVQSSNGRTPTASSTHDGRPPRPCGLPCAQRREWILH